MKGYNQYDRKLREKGLIEMEIEIDKYLFEMTDKEERVYDLNEINSNKSPKLKSLGNNTIQNKTYISKSFSDKEKKYLEEEYLLDELDLILYSTGDYFSTKELFMLQCIILMNLGIKPSSKQTLKEKVAAKVFYRKLLHQLNRAFKDIVAQCVLLREDSLSETYDLTNKTFKNEKKETVKAILFSYIYEGYNTLLNDFTQTNPNFDYDNNSNIDIFEKIMKNKFTQLTEDIFNFVFYIQPENFENVELVFEEVLEEYKNETKTQFTEFESGYFSKLKKGDLKGTARNRIYNMDFHDLHRQIEPDSVNAIITDSPYFYDYNNKAWDAFLNEEERYEFFKGYFQSVAHTIKDDAVIVFFNLYENIPQINKAIEDVSKDERYPEFNFTVLPYLEYTKLSPTAHLTQKRKSEYIALAVNNWEDSFLGDTGILKNGSIDISLSDKFENKKFKSHELIREAMKNGREIFDSPSNIYNTNGVIHTTTKPAYLLDIIIQRFTAEDWVILDSFSGSGSISLAAYENNRTSVACELDTYMMLRSNIRLHEFRRRINKKAFKLNAKDAIYEVSLTNKSSKEAMNRYFYMPLVRMLNIEERVQFLNDFIESLSERKKKHEVTFHEVQQTERDRAILTALSNIYNTKEFEEIFGLSSRNPIQLFEENNFSVDEFNVFARAVRFSKIATIPADYIVQLDLARHRLDNYKEINDDEQIDSVNAYLSYLHQLVQDLLVYEFKLKKELLNKESYEKEEKFYVLFTYILKSYEHFTKELVKLKGVPLPYLYTIDELYESNHLLSMDIEQLKKERKRFNDSYSFKHYKDFKTIYVIEGSLNFYDEVSNIDQIIQRLDIDNIKNDLDIADSEILSQYTMVSEKGSTTKRYGDNLKTFYLTLNDYKYAEDKMEYLAKLNKNGVVFKNKNALIEQVKVSKEAEKNVVAKKSKSIEKESDAVHSNRKKSKSTIDSSKENNTKKSEKKKRVKINTEEVKELYLSGMTQKEIADKFNTKSATIYHHIKKIKKNGDETEQN
ncbi:hypothetical protein CI088_07585 [Enterococcus plantarum]|uniref:DNA methylase N-4/N-6 domain-containing protein n=2 Tax=Enterococcus plantarum TaxID=1077675 RepID=A0A2W4BN24_9ENTE|nr:hypothetical protein CI088_07585 [Enterococcus plantarum]